VGREEGGGEGEMVGRDGVGRDDGGGEGEMVGSTFVPLPDNVTLASLNITDRAARDFLVFNRVPKVGHSC
jgi:hypothetical protein